MSQLATIVSRVATLPAFWAVVLFASTATYVQMRGRVRLKLRRQILDHSTFVAPYNVLMYWFSATPNTPFLDLSAFPELKPLTDNWTTIRDEALALFDGGYIRSAEKHNDAGFRSFFRVGWKRFYVKWYDDALPSARALCPKTSELVAGIGSINAAMFALLPPGARLGAHRDPLAVSLRYHLGLETPNSPGCFIAVDGKPYYWRDGEAVMFDETYVHTAENLTEETRLILLCDIERPLTSRFVRWLNRRVGHVVVRAGASPNLEGDREGVLSTIASGVHRLQLIGKRIKAWHGPTYFVMKKALLLLALYLIFF